MFRQKRKFVRGHLAGFPRSLTVVIPDPDIEVSRPMIDVSHIRHVALDMDGTIYKGATLYHFTPGFLALLKQLGIGYTFLTNNSSKSVDAYVKHLARMGVAASADEIFTSTDSTIVY